MIVVDLSTCTFDNHNNVFGRRIHRIGNCLRDIYNHRKTLHPGVPHTFRQVVGTSNGIYHGDWSKYSKYFQTRRE